MNLLLLPLFLATSISAFTTSNPSYTSISSSFSKSINTQLKMSEIEQPDVSSYMSGSSQPEGTEDFVMQQTMIRVKDPKKSLDFYCNVLGFKLIYYNEVSTGDNDVVREICNSMLCKYMHYTFANTSDESHTREISLCCMILICLHRMHICNQMQLLTHITHNPKFHTTLFSYLNGNSMSTLWHHHLK